MKIEMAFEKSLISHRRQHPKNIGPQITLRAGKTSRVPGQSLKMTNIYAATDQI